MSQPPLSRAIQKLERRLGVTLLQRSSRAITLTEAGAVLLREARTALDAVDAAERRTHRAASSRPTLVLASKAGASGDLLARLLDAYAAEPDALTVDVTLCGPGEPERLLRNGKADVAILQHPYDSIAGFDTEDLHNDEQVLVLPAAHPLADWPRMSLSEIDELIDLPLPRWPRSDGTYPDGQGPRVRDHTQLTQLIRLGRACALMPASIRTQIQEGYALVPVPDAPAVTTVLAWPPHSRSRAVANFVRAAAHSTTTKPR